MLVDNPDVDRPEVERPAQDANMEPPADASTSQQFLSRSNGTMGTALETVVIAATCESIARTVPGLILGMVKGHVVSSVADLWALGIEGHIGQVVSGAAQAVPQASEEETAERKDAEKSVTTVRSPMELEGERVEPLLGEGGPAGAIAFSAKTSQSVSQEPSTAAGRTDVAVEWRPLFLGMASRVEGASNRGTRI